MIVPARRWEEIESAVARNTELSSLVRYIRDSGLSERLFAILSLDTLIVGSYEPIEFHKETVHIRFDQPSGQWQFNYYATPYKPPEFARTYERAKGIEKFRAFIELINWV